MVKDGMRESDLRVVDLDVSGTITGNSLYKASSQTTVWYVDSNKLTGVSGNGSTWDESFITIEEALTAAGDYDTIYIGAGDYEIDAALEITQDNLTIIGPNRSANDYKALIYTSAADNIIEVDANNVTIVGLGLSAVGGNGHGIAIAGTTSSYKLYVARCRFDGYGKTGYGIKSDDTQDQPDLVVEDCLFRSWATGAIYANGTRGVFRRNMIFVDASSIGINFAQTAGNRPDSMAYENYIIGSNSSDTGIKIAATEPTDGTLLIANNVVTNCNLNITQDKSDAGLVNNGTYGNGAALVQVDPNAA
jgi:hypothetical protein